MGLILFFFGVFFYLFPLRIPTRISKYIITYYYITYVRVLVCLYVCLSIIKSTVNLCSRWLNLIYICMHVFVLYSPGVCLFFQSIKVLLRVSAYSGRIEHSNQQQIFFCYPFFVFFFIKSSLRECVVFVLFSIY